MNLPGWSVCRLIGFKPHVCSRAASGMWVLNAARGACRTGLAAGSLTGAREESPPSKHPSTLWKRRKRDVWGESRSYLPERSSLWTVSMVIAVSSYVLFNLLALERSHVMFISVFFFIFSWLSHIVPVWKLTLQANTNHFSLKSVSWHVQ